MAPPGNSQQPGFSFMKNQAKRLPKLLFTSSYLLMSRHDGMDLGNLKTGSILDNFGNYE